MKEAIKKLWTRLKSLIPFVIRKKVAPEHVLEMMAPFVRTGYNRAIVDVQGWIYDNYRDKDSVPYMELADFMLTQMNEKKIVTSNEVLREMVKQHKEKAIDKKDPNF